MGSVAERALRGKQIRLKKAEKAVLEAIRNSDIGYITEDEALRIIRKVTGVTKRKAKEYLEDLEINDSVFNEDDRVSEWYDKEALKTYNPSPKEE
jgi:intergrase/recombinase